MPVSSDTHCLGHTHAHTPTLLTLACKGKLKKEASQAAVKGVLIAHLGVSCCPCALKLSLLLFFLSVAAFGNMMPRHVPLFIAKRSPLV